MKLAVAAAVAAAALSASHALELRKREVPAVLALRFERERTAKPASSLRRRAGTVQETLDNFEVGSRPRPWLLRGLTLRSREACTLPT